MIDLQELMACPFCGERPDIWRGVSSTAVYCANDQCIIYATPSTAHPFNDYGHFDAAVSAWNRRSPAFAEMALVYEAWKAAPQVVCGHVRNVADAQLDRALDSAGYYVNAPIRIISIDPAAIDAAASGGG